MRILQVALLVSWLVIGGLVYLFFFKGSVAEGSDGRTAIVLTQGERDFVLTEMRGFLNAVQQIIEGLDEKDMKKVKEAAHEVGMANMAEVPGSLMRKLPMGFKQMGHPTHAAFDELAAEAADMGERDKIINQLATLMQNCVACHNSYRLEVGKE